MVKKRKGQNLNSSLADSEVHIFFLIISWMSFDLRVKINAIRILNVIMTTKKDIYSFGISLKRYVQMLYEEKHETLLRDKK